MTTDGVREEPCVDIVFDESGHVATILIDRQRKLNALTLAILDDVASACQTIDASSARVVLIRTGGTRVFSVGADINHFAGLGAAEMWRTWVRTGHRALTALEQLRQPTIAVVDGLAYGGGLELALAADFRILSSRSTLCFPETGLGTVPGWGGSARLADLVGRHRAKDMILTRRVLSASEALDWGIASRVSATEDPESEVSSLLESLLYGAPLAVQMAKQLVTSAQSGNSNNVLEALAAAAAATSDDLAEGIAAFREKRPPSFHDR